MYICCKLHVQERKTMQAREYRMSELGNEFCFVVC